MGGEMISSGLKREEPPKPKEVLDVATLKRTIETLLATQKATARKFELNVKNGQIIIDAVVDHPKKSNVGIKGVLGNVGNEIVLVGKPEIKAGLLSSIVSMAINPVLSRIGQEIRQYFEKTSGRSIDSLKIEDGGLTLNFKVSRPLEVPQPTPEPEKQELYKPPEATVASEPPAPPEVSEPREIKLPDTTLDDLSVPTSEEIENLPGPTEISEESKEESIPEVPKEEVVPQVPVEKKAELPVGRQRGLGRAARMRQEAFERTARLEAEAAKAEKGPTETEKKIEDLKSNIEEKLGGEAKKKGISAVDLAEIKRIAAYLTTEDFPRPEDAETFNRHETEIFAERNRLREESKKVEVKKEVPKPIENKSEEKLDAKILADIELFAKRIYYGNMPAKEGSKAFLERHKDKIMARVEELKAEGWNSPLEVKRRQGAWNALPDAEKLRIVTEKMRSRKQQTWLPEELEYQQNNGEKIEKARKDFKESAKSEKELKKKIKEIAWLLYEDGEVTDAESKKILEENPEAVEQAREAIAKHDPDRRKTERVLEGIMDKQREKYVVTTQVETALQRLGIDKRFVSGYNKDFFSLAEEAQIYILEKLRQVINRDATLEAEDQVAKDLDKTPNGFGETIGRFWKKMGQAKLIEKSQKEKAAKMMASNEESVMDNFSVLVDHVKNLKYPISHTSEGELYFKYEKEEGTPQEAEFMQKFNVAATRLAEMPLEWGSKRATKSQRKEYEKAKEQYEIRKRIVYDEKRGKYDYDKTNIKEKEKAAFEWVNLVDLEVKSNRIIVNNPEILRMKGDDGKIEKTFNNILTKNPELQAFIGGASGLLTRYLWRGSEPLLTGAVIAVAGGTFMGIRRQDIEYQNLARRKRFGREIKDAGLNRYLNVGTTVKRIEKLIEKIKISDGDKKDELIALLRLRLNIVDKAISSNRINFTDKYENILRLSKVMSEGGLMVFRNSEDGKDLMRGLEARFNRVNKRLDKKRNVWLNRATNYGLSVGGSIFALGGTFFSSWMAMDSVREIGSGQTFSERLREIFHRWGNNPANQVEPQFLPPAPGWKP